MTDKNTRPVSNRHRLIVLSLFAVIAITVIVTQVLGPGNEKEPGKKHIDAKAAWKLEPWHAPDGKAGFQAYIRIDSADSENQGRKEKTSSPRVLGFRCKKNAAIPVSVFVNAGVALSHQKTVASDYRFKGCARPRKSPKRVDPYFDLPIGVVRSKPLSPEESRKYSLINAQIREAWKKAKVIFHSCAQFNGGVDKRKKELPLMSLHIKAGKKSVPNFLLGHYRDFGRAITKALCTDFNGMTVLEAPSSFHEERSFMTIFSSAGAKLKTFPHVHDDVIAHYLLKGDRVVVTHPAHPKQGGCMAADQSGGSRNVDTVSFKFSMKGARDIIAKLKQACGLSKGQNLRTGPTRPYSKYDDLIYEPGVTSLISLPPSRSESRHKSYGDCRDKGWTKYTGFLCQQ